MSETLEFFPLPKYEDLPDLELYMDQVINLVERYLGSSFSRDGKGLTAAMVNNYVKMKVLPPPVRKRYTRSHLVYLLVLCTLKPVLPLRDISLVLHSELERLGEEVFYRKFREGMQHISELVAGSCASDEAVPDLAVYAPAILHSAIAARAEQALAEALLGRLDKAAPEKPAAKTPAKSAEKPAKPAVKAKSPAKES
jgi:hypothetical protein